MKKFQCNREQLISQISYLWIIKNVAPMILLKVSRTANKNGINFWMRFPNSSKVLFNIGSKFFMKWKRPVIAASPSKRTSLEHLTRFSIVR